MKRLKTAARSESGLTLVETTVATAVLVLLAMALGGSAHVILSSQRALEEADLVRDLGISLLDEITALPFEDPDSATVALGPEPGEWEEPWTRDAFNDVDDYAVWNGMPLQHKDGTPLNIEGYTRAVTVRWVDPGGFGSDEDEPTHYKKITVTVYRSGHAAGSFVALRAGGGRHVDVRE